MRILLDTHVLLWALASPHRLPASARRLIVESDVLVSAASIWEVSIKAALGKLKADPREILDAVEPAGFALMPITGQHAAAVYRVPLLHRDPFDRMLLAQAFTEPLVLLTDDAVLLRYGELVRSV